MIAYRRSLTALGKEINNILRAMKAEGSEESRARNGEGVTLPTEYKPGESRGFGLREDEDWPAGLGIKWPQD